MLPTLWLILVASAFGGLMSKTGMLTRAIAPLLRWVKTTGSLIVASAATATGYALVILMTPLVLLAAAMWSYRNEVIPARENLDDVYGEVPLHPPTRRTSI